MSELLERAFNALKALPEEDRNRIAHEIIERVEDKSEWDRIVNMQASQDWLEKVSKEALKAYQKNTKNMTLKFVNLGLDNLLREESYWETFDDLPKEVRKLAEQNYQLWKQNSMNPGLRFKQIHKTLPIFSFRVGMKHRTVGVETHDGEIAWFWVGSFKNFKELVGL